MSKSSPQAEGITRVSAQALIRLRLQAGAFLLDSQKIRARQGGAYLSTFKGRGMEFDESRIYQPGDDIRNMDWRVTARTGNAHTKVFREERERPVLLWLDLSRSMMFATRNKFKAVIAAELASLLAWSANQNGDRVGGLIFSENEHIELKPRRGKAAVLDFIGRCAQHGAWNCLFPEQDGPVKSGDSDTTTEARRNSAEAAARLRKVAHTGGLIFMLSDFRYMSKKAYSHIANISRHNSIVFIQITDPLEKQLPARGFYKLTDGQKEITLNAGNSKLRNDYRQRYQQRQHKLDRFCRQNGIHRIEISTADNAQEKLKAGLLSRQPDHDRPPSAGAPAAKKPGGQA